MLGRLRSLSRARRPHSSPSSASRYRVLRSEPLELRELLSVNTAPVVAQGITINGNVAVTGKTAAISVLGSDDGGESKLSYLWSVSSEPSGAAVGFSLNNSNSAKNSVATFTKAGTYVLSVTIVDAAGLSVTSTKSVTVNPTLTSIVITTSSGQVVNTSSPARTSAVSQSLIAQGFDQFGNLLTVQPTFQWSMSTVQSGAPTPIIVANGAAATVNFAKVGSYGVTVQATNSAGATIASTATIVDTAQPTYITISQLSSTGTTAVFAVSQFLDQFRNLLPVTSTVTWAATSVPTGAAAPTFILAGGNTAVTFKAAGTYVLTATERDNYGDVVSQSITVTVGQAVSGFKNVPASLITAGTNVILVTPTLVDQFGNTLAVPPLVWSAVQMPTGTALPTFSNSGSLTTITFNTAGTYVLMAKDANAQNITFTTTVIVSQTLTSIAVTPNTASVYQGGTQQFTAQALDQFRNAMATQPTFLWSDTAGTITSGGMFTAPTTLGNCTITARSGSLSGTATVTVKSAGALQDATLAKLVQTLDADGSISRADMLQILRSVGVSGTVSATDFADLKTIINQASVLNMADYVRVLASDVVLGNVANATYQGQALGNLAAGSSATQLNALISKWFLGADHPTICNSSLTYKSAAGSLYPHTPSHTDEYQGMLGDCYFISALGTIADSNPAAIQNMIIDNGDGTYTVRFYTGNYGTSGIGTDGGISAGFSGGTITADYVTVDRMLPASSTGIMGYADYGASITNAGNSLWIPLLEKAYAQWNQTGKEGRDGTNAYASIQGGWMATVDAQVLGHNATDYIMTTTSAQMAINALAAKKAVTIGTNNFSNTLYGLYGSHAYAITGYNASTNTFTLYNPWGSNQPGQLTWAQLQASCSQMCIDDTSGSTPMTSAAVSGTTGKVSASTPALAASPAESDNVSSSESKISLATPSHGSTGSELGAGHGTQIAESTDASRRVFQTWETDDTMVSHAVGSASEASFLDAAPADKAMLATDQLLQYDLVADLS